MRASGNAGLHLRSVGGGNERPGRRDVVREGVAGQGGGSGKEGGGDDAVHGVFLERSGEGIGSVVAAHR
jgi:hypothetical protein